MPASSGPARKSNGTRSPPSNAFGSNGVLKHGFLASTILKEFLIRNEAYRGIFGAVLRYKHIASVQVNSLRAQLFNGEHAF